MPRARRAAGFRRWKERLTGGLDADRACWQGRSPATGHEDAIAIVMVHSPYGPKSSMSRLRHAGMGFEDRAEKRRRVGHRWIEGAVMVVLCVLFFYVYGYGLGLDEDPTTGVSPVVFGAVTLGGLIAAAVMLRRGIMLVRSARRQQRRQQKARERAHRKR